MNTFISWSGGKETALAFYKTVEFKTGRKRLEDNHWFLELGH